MKASTHPCCGITFRGLVLGGMLASLSLAAACAAIALAVPGQQSSPQEASPAEAPPPEVVAKPNGKELFAREWIANDPRSPRGDGLGPVFNDSSCVACHNQGGAGGGGPANKNVHILTSIGFMQQNETGLTASPARSFVLHHFGTDAEFAAWRAKTAQAAVVAMTVTGPVASGLQRVVIGTPPTDPSVPGATAPVPEAPSSRDRVGPAVITTGDIDLRSLMGSQISQRNATALFGAGRIDAIPERVLEAIVAQKHARFPKVAGRVARDDKGRVGRFGWKAQKASLDDFVLTACAVELGLHVPGHDQPPLPHKPDYKAPGLDLTADECNALVKYVADLPAPVETKAEHAKHAEFIASGKALFTTVGCATCHTPKLGDVEGIYSDLLLHDMGPGLTDAGSSYGIFQPNPQPSAPQSTPKPQDIVKGQGPGSQQPTGSKQPTVVATAQEWRTPPLWGVRDSGPYLHDGRAHTLEQAIALHLGQAEDSTVKFNALPLADKQKLLAFLKSLVAPEQLAAR